MTDRLDATERAQLAKAERTIRRGLRTFVQVGEALLEIRDQRLYRETHTSFEAYCRERWSLSKTHSNRIVQAAQVVKELAPTGSAPTSERQARELAGLLRDPARLRQVWQAATTSGRPTAAKIREAARASIDHPETPALGGAGEGAPSDPPGGTDRAGAPDDDLPEPQPVSPPEAGPESGGQAPRRPDGGADGASPPLSPLAGGGAPHLGPLLTAAEIHEALTDEWSPSYLDDFGCRMALVHQAEGAPLDRAVAGAIRQSRRPGALPERAKAVAG